MAITRQADLEKYTFYDKDNAGMLNLERAEITDEFVITVLVPYLKNNKDISKVLLTNNMITNKGAIILSSVATLRELYLGGNQIGSTGAAALARHKSLLLLILDDNAICDKGFAAFKDSRVLKTLHANRCAISDEGVLEFATNRSVTYLSLTGNPITEIGVKALDINPVLEKRFVDGFPMASNSEEPVSKSELINQQQALMASQYPVEDNRAAETLAIPAVENRRDEEVLVVEAAVAPLVQANPPGEVVVADVSVVEPAGDKVPVAEAVQSEALAVVAEVVKDSVPAAEEQVDEEQTEHDDSAASEAEFERSRSPVILPAEALVDDLAVFPPFEPSAAPQAVQEDTQPAEYTQTMGQLLKLMRPATHAPVPSSVAALPARTSEASLTSILVDSAKEFTPKFATVTDMYAALAELSLQDYAAYLQRITLQYLQEKLLGGLSFSAALKSPSQYQGKNEEAAKRILLSYLVLYMKQLEVRSGENSSVFGWAMGKPRKDAKQAAATKCFELLSGPLSLATIDATLDYFEEFKSALVDKGLLGEGNLSVFRERIKWVMDPKNREVPDLIIKPRK